MSSAFSKKIITKAKKLACRGLRGKKKKKKQKKSSNALALAPIFYYNSVL